jgi:preprotein translocase subunit YajC
MKKIIKWFLNLIEERKRKKRLKKKLEELKKRDPFIYNH